MTKRASIRNQIMFAGCSPKYAPDSVMYFFYRRPRRPFMTFERERIGGLFGLYHLLKMFENKAFMTTQRMRKAKLAQESM